MLSKILELENELKLTYTFGAIGYVDDRFDGVWSKAINRLEQAILEWQKNDNTETLKVEIKIYRQQILEFIEIFKQSKRGGKIENFLDSLT